VIDRPQGVVGSVQSRIHSRRKGGEYEVAGYGRQSSSEERKEGGGSAESCA